MNRAHSAVSVALFALFSFASLADPAWPAADKAAPADPWKQIEELLLKDRVEEAADVAARVREAARKAGNEAEWTRALVQETQLRVLPLDYEEGYRLLKGAEWPRDPVSQAILHLYVAEILRAYDDRFSYDVDQRERIERTDGGGTIDLARATRGEIYAALLTEAEAAWGERERLSDVPLSQVYRYLAPNDYPREVRGTLRDAVSYLLVRLLADSSFWTPAEAQDLPVSTLERLISEDGDVRPSDLAVHPLARMAAVLGDLEQWHTARGELAGALEARRERLRLLGTHFTEPEERQLLRADLEKRLPAFRGVSWWSMGMATLAEFVREAGDLVGAQKIAREGHEAYPGSPGGLRCLEIAEEIEAPAFQLSGMASDGLGRRSVRVQHKGLDRLRFRAYAIDLESRLKTLGSYDNFFPSPAELTSEKPVMEWDVDLPPTPDFQLHQTYVTPPVQRPGAYLIVATPLPEDPGLRAALGIVLGDLVLLSQPGVGESEVTALSGSTGEPMPGVALQAYAREYGSSPVLRGTAITGPDGRVRLPFAANDSGFVIGRRGEEIAYTGTGSTEERQPVKPATLFFTDRAIYRPQQTLYWKILVYSRPAGGEPKLAAGREVTMQLLDPNGQEVQAATVTTNDFGTAAGSFVIPLGRPLGFWTLKSSAGDSEMIRVEEYKRPTFEVTLDDPAGALRLGRPATFSGKARYYFGLPVTDGEVRWQVLREPVWAHDGWWGWAPPASQPLVVASGTSPVDDQGAFELTFTPAEDESAGAKGTNSATWRFRVKAEVTSAAGETREAERQFRLGTAAVEARIRLEEDGNFLLAQTPAVVSVVRSSLDGLPRPGAGTWALLRLRQPHETLLPADQPLPEREGYQTPGDALRPREDPDYQPGAVLAGWQDGDRVASGTVHHKGDGEADIALPGLPAGAYRLQYSTVDEFGTEVTTQRDLLVAGPKTPLALPVLLLAERPTVRVGGTIRLLAHSGLDDQPLALEIYRDGRLRERRTLGSRHKTSLLDLPVGPEDRGGLAFKLIGVRDHQLLAQTAQVFVPWDRELSIELSTFRDKLRPGARETWTVTVRSPREGGSEAAAAEVLALMYDRSLDAFSQHALPDPLSLFPNRASLWTTQASLGPAPLTAYPYWRREDRSPGLRGDRLRLPVYDSDLPWAELLMTPANAEEARRLGELDFPSAPGVMGGVAAPMMAAAPESALDDAKMVPPPPAPPPPPPPAPKPQQAAAEAPSAPVALRSDFRETALWEPQLLTGPDGSAKIEFTVPDSVTSWNVWLRALTRDLRAGALDRQVESVKELMVRPYLPRFLREGDQAALKVAVDNASAGSLSGEVTLDVIDPETEESLLADFGLTRETARRPFTAAAGGGTTVSFPLATPRRVGPVAFRVTAATSGAQDGELRPLPILPARMHLAQSRSVALREKGSREMTFADLARNDDPTRATEQLVVTVDGQLFYGLLAALPYLIDYPYECTEQTLNRFVSTGILTGLFDQHPEVARMAEELARRDTPLETWDAADPNRKMSLEETPWLAESQGRRSKDDDLPSLRVLDPRVAKAEQASALEKLRKAQLDSGAFPWWPGGPASPYMTVYLLYGFAKAHEFGLEVPYDMAQGAWSYLASWYKGERKDELKSCGCWPLATFLNYAAAVAPNDWTMGTLSPEDRQDILKMSWKHRFEMKPYLKAMLALTLHRMGRTEDGRQLLLGTLESAKTTPDEGTFWTEGEHGWLWYEDTVETHAFVLRAVEELLPDDARRHGLVQWLFLNKQLNHWRSTRDTAEVIYAVAVYLEKEGQLGTREEATVRIGERRQDFVFEPNRYTGKENRIVVPGEQVKPSDAKIVVEKPAPGFLFATATWHFSTENLPAQGDGQLFQVDRRFFRRVKTGQEAVLQPLEEGDVLHPGDEVEVHLRIRSRVAAEYVHLRDPRPAGLEPEGAHSGWRWGAGAWWYEETRDSGMNFFFESLPAGEYTLKHRVRANMAGTFKAGPATIQSMYAPEHTAYSAGREVRVE